MNILKKLIYLLTVNERKRAITLLSMILLMALLDMIGVASILPFMAVLTNPGIIETNYILNTTFQAASLIGVKTSQEFLFTLGIMVFCLLVLSLSFKALTIYAEARFVSMRSYSIAKRLVVSYLQQPYSWFLGRHSAELGKNILSEVGIVVGKGLQNMIRLIARIIVVITFLILLIIINPKLTLIIGLVLGVAYLLIYLFTRKFITLFGEERLKANELTFTAINETFGAAKEVKLGGLEHTFFERFSVPALILASREALIKCIANIPRLGIEIVTFGGMLLIVLYMYAQGESFINVIPIITLYAFAGYRLLPALQEIFHCITLLKYAKPSIDKLYNDLKSLRLDNSSQDLGVLQLNKKITLNSICYQYPNSSRTVLKDINLTIAARTTVGLVGSTGSGKTTLVDIILGLLDAQKGTLKVDDKIINKNNIRSWQRSIGYVPQHIYLTDDTIAANIAFGVEPKKIDQEAVKRAAVTANLNDFVVNELSQQYNTTVGERGVRLSGGQRQRIGIARALYHNPQVLILDEATSALDNLTEQAVMEAVHNLGKHITIILIAHRLTTVKNCDKIFLFEKGKFKSQGTFEELFNSSSYFQKFATVK
ncbi:ABC transporter ATP-binding protein/permease [Candidatus Pelagibacter sp.]|nr:ABC transporter ATP-binding protein/permease [Candidatus Pelagibacter sp.]